VHDCVASPDRPLEAGVERSLTLFDPTVRLATSPTDPTQFAPSPAIDGRGQDLLFSAVVGSGGEQKPDRSFRIGD
jgi:hypothetical protein